MHDTTWLRESLNLPDAFRKIVDSFEAAGAGYAGGDARHTDVGTEESESAQRRMIMRNGIPVLGAVLALLSFSSNAATDCNGTVTRVLLYADGSVNLLSSWRGDYTYLCNTNGTFGSIPAEICLSWYGTALNAAAHGKQINVYYGATLNCATLPTYGSAPVPTYVGLIG